MTGQVFNIQRFSTHDGPGIRTTVFLKGCPLRCLWCQNPESQSLRPVLMVNDGACSGCGRCEAVCPRGACSLRDGVAVVDRARCTACGACVSACMNGARSIAGEAMEAEAVIDTVLRDAAMYRNSGGGMTLSGGEVTAQPEFARELLSLARGHGIHTAIETCGYAKWETLRSLLELSDLVMYDIKCVDPGRHRDGTGVDNRLIIENAARAAAMRPIAIRMPLIPGYNDTADDVRALAELARRELHVSAGDIELLAYNNLGEAKYSRLGRSDGLSGRQRQSDEYLAGLYGEIRAVFAGHDTESVGV